jgi:hypothetical protein
MLLLDSHCVSLNWDLQDRDLIIASKPEVTKEGTVQQFVGLEPALGVSRQNIKKKIGNQYMTMWQGLTSSQSQAWELISGASPAAKTRLLSINRMQSRVVTGLLTGCNTLRRCFYIRGVTDSPLCRRCGAEEEASAHILYEWSWGGTQPYLPGLLFLDPEDFRSLSLRAVLNIIKGVVLQWLGCQSKRHIGSVKGLCVSRPKMAQTHYSFHSIASIPATLAYGTVVHDFRCMMTDSILNLTARLISVKFSLA